jgi:hypothetical protein
MAAPVRGEPNVMTPIPRLLSKAADAAVDLARASVQLAVSAAEIARAEIRDRRRAPMPADPAPAAPRTPPPAPPAPARAAAPASAPAPAPAPTRAPAPIAVVPEPTRGEAARIREAQREAERTEDGPGPEIRVDEPWPGYTSMNAPEIIDRVKASDDATKAIVLLYERSHRKRKTVLAVVQP